jgi:IS30 family transposase
LSERYYQLTQEQKLKLEAYLESGKNQTQIAGLLGVHKSTISRELCRNVPKRGTGSKIYNASNAQVKTDNRHQFKHKHTTFSVDLNNQMKDWMETKRYSPELVSAQWKKDRIGGVSHECMYNFIWD